MPVKFNKEGKLEYYKERPLRFLKDFFFGEKRWNRMEKSFVQPMKKKGEPYKGYEPDTETTSASSASSSSCSPEDCPSCSNKDCPNSYDDFIDKGEMEI